MVNKVGRFVLFISSYAPLWGILALQLHDNRLLSLSCFGLCLIGLAVPAFILNYARTHGSVPLLVAESESKSDSFIAYLFSYIIPFIGLNEVDVYSGASTAIFFFMVMIIYIHSDLIYMNPVLSFYGYKVFRVQDSKGINFHILSSDDFIRSGETIDVVRISGNEFVHKLRGGAKRDNP